MGFLEAKCPACAKEIRVPDDSKRVYCAYCGSRFLRDAALAYAGALDKISSRGTPFDESDFTIIGGTLVDYRGESVDIVIPEGVTCIDDEAFKGNKNVVRVEMPDTVTSIGAGAFEDCTSLSEVEFSKNLVTIKNSAFYGCASLRAIELPSTLKEIGAHAFGKCSSLSVANVPSTASYRREGDPYDTFNNTPAKIVRV